MSNYFEIAYAAASGRLCLFTGTGFSKAVTANAAPSWQGLLESLCALLPVPSNTNLKTALFPIGAPNPLPLEEAAQVIDIELHKIGKSAHEEIASLIRGLALVGDNKPIVDFIDANIFEVVTTNYDKLFQQLASQASPQTITPGLPIPRSSAKIQVYHVHGSIDSPRNMVVTSDDYFRFLNSESYFAKKLSTILHENTVAILGYSLGDTNLKTILSDYKGFSRTNVIGGNIFLVSRSGVDQHIKDYYAHSFAIRVIDQTEVMDFFRQVNAALPDAVKCVDSSKTNIKKVLYENFSFTDNYLQVESSFFEVIASISAVGVSLNSAAVVKLVGAVIDKKIGFTNTYGAWPQYGHLATWLTYLASLIDFAGTEIQDTFLKATLRSMETMSKGQELGYSWQAYRTWYAGWPSLTPGNRNLVRNYIQANTKRADALELVARL
jgi:SIR2-like domain